MAESNNAAYRVYDLNLAAGERVDLDVTADGLVCLEADGPMEVAFDDGRLSHFERGFKLKLPTSYRRLSVVNGFLASAIRLAAFRGDFFDQRFVPVVDPTPPPPDPGPTIGPTYLSDLSEFYIGSRNTSGVSGSIKPQLFSNPATSGRLVMLYQVRIARLSVAGTAPTTPTAFNMRLASTVSLAPGFAGIQIVAPYANGVALLSDDTAISGGQTIASISVGPASEFLHRFEHPLVLDEGFSLEVRPAALQNLFFSCVYEYRELPK